MNTVIIDGRSMVTRAAAHGELARALSFPEHYGANLDALWDALSEAEAHLILTHPEALLAALGPYGQSLLLTLTEAGKKFPGFTLEIDE